MMQQTLQLLDYLATQEDAVLSYHASDMVLGGSIVEGWVGPTCAFLMP